MRYILASRVYLLLKTIVYIYTKKGKITGIMKYIFIVLFFTI